MIKIGDNIKWVKIDVKKQQQVKKRREKTKIKERLGNIEECERKGEKVIFGP